MAGKDVFGSPDAGDDVAVDEHVIETASREQAEFVKSILAGRRRAPGSKKIPLPEQDSEWELARTDPNMIQEFYVSQGATFEEAILDAESRERRRK